MKSKLLTTNQERTFIVVLEKGDEAFASLTRFAQENGIAAASVTGIGAFGSATLGFFDFQSKSYDKIPVDQQSEVLSLIGDIAIGDDGKPSLHLHTVLGLAHGKTLGGHFLEGNVNPTLEVMVHESPVHLRRRKNPDLGIALIDA
jgi:predicted DNA-binding protein with PD1-like motif